MLIVSFICLYYIGKLIGSLVIVGSDYMCLSFSHKYARLCSNGRDIKEKTCLSHEEGF